MKTLYILILGPAMAWTSSAPARPAKGAFAIEALGNVRTEVMWVFTEEEFSGIVTALP